MISKRAAPSTGTMNLTISAPKEAPVVITATRWTIFARHEIDDLTQIRCGYGAGGYAATTGSLNLSANDATLRLSTDRPQQGVSEFVVPPDQFRVDAGLTEVIEVHGAGLPGLYEWSLEVEAIIDQRPVKQVLGDAVSPLVTFIGPDEAADVYPTVDWDIIRCAWTDMNYGVIDQADPRNWSCP
ncbi:MAG: hypothetical protein LC808_28650 [Actinobacteria bacterium]|nr:hypothetical protein [Actinomycetota bacterium]